MNLGPETTVTRPAMIENSTSWSRLALIVLVLGACGPNRSAATIEISVDEYAFYPATVTVPADSVVTVELASRDFILHTWTLLSAGEAMTSAVDLEEGRILASVERPAGVTARTSFDSPSPGSYQIICTVPGHLEEGMTATLVVTP